MVLVRATVALQRLSAHTRYSTRPLAAPHALFSVQSREFLRYPYVRGPMYRLTAVVNATVASVPLAEVRTRSFGSFAGASAQAPLCSKLAEHGNVIIRDPEELERKKTAMRAAGLNKIQMIGGPRTVSCVQVIADFDMTLTRFRINGERGLSCHSIIKTDDEGINAERRQVHDKYYPMEIDPTISKEDKLPLMEAWWSASHRLILEGGVSRKGIQDCVGCANIAFREGTEDLLEALFEVGVPVLIFSAGIADVIEEVMRQKLRRQVSNVRVVSNRMEFDEGGRVIGFKGPLIHVLNKNEHALELPSSPPSLPNPSSISTPPSETHIQHTDLIGASASSDPTPLKNRTNVVLLGDHMGDLRMSDGVAYDHRIAIAFLNDNVEAQLGEYTSAFDIVILNDGSMDVVLDLVHSLQ